MAKSRFPEILGNVYGMLTVVKRIVPQIGRTVKYECLCSCGRTRIVSRSNLISGGTKSCGYHKHIDLTGKTFGKLKIINIIEETIGHGVIKWNCLCECGKEIIVTSNSLLMRNTRSCGCWRSESISKRCFKGYNDISGKYWSTVKTGARNRGLTFNITMDFIWDLYLKQQKKCALSGLDIEFNHNHKEQTASIDRIYNNIGYELNNVQIVHKDINIMKNKYDQEYFIKCCINISNKYK